MDGPRGVDVVLVMEATSATGHELTFTGELTMFATAAVVNNTGSTNDVYFTIKKSTEHKPT